jgi:glycosyltransferase involved in cell wall biosynthesis
VKILIVSIDDSKSILAGGKHIHQELFEKGLTEMGHEVRTIYFEPKGKFWLWFRVWQKIIRSLRFRRWVNMPVSRWKFIERQIKKDLVLLLRAWTPDLISSQDPLAGRAALEIVGKEIPVFATLHGYFTREMINYSYLHPKFELEGAREYCQQVEKDHITGASGVVAVDSNIGKYAREDLGYSRALLVRFNSIDDDRFNPIHEDERRKLKLKHALSLEQPVCLVARRLVLKNGVHQAIVAFGAVKKSTASFQLVILGDGPEAKNLKQQVIEESISDHVIFKGSIPHAMVNEYYQLADLVLMPSTRSDDIEEATSLSMLEGMACGAPVLATAIGGMKEVIRDSENGFLTPDKDTDQMARKLQMILNNLPELRRSVGNTASQEVHRYFGFRQHAQEILRFAQENS